MANANAINIASNGLISFSGTQFNANSITNHAVLIGNSTGGVTNVGPGTAGQVLLSAGSSSDPSFVTPTGAGMVVTANASTFKYELGGGYVLIQSQTASSQATLDFTTGVGTPYNCFALVYSAVLGPGMTILLAQLSLNTGSTFINTGYQSGVYRWGNSSQANTNSTAGLGIGSTDTTNPQSGIVYFTNMRNNAFPVLLGRANRTGNLASATNSYSFMGTYPTNITVDAIRITSASGGNFSGVFTLYGFKEG